MKTRLYKAKNLNIFKLLSYSTDALTLELVGKVFKELPRSEMLVLLRGQLRECFLEASEDSSSNVNLIEDLARWVNRSLPAWDRDHLFTAQSCNVLLKYLTMAEHLDDRPESVDLLHTWLVESREQENILNLTRA